MRIEPLAKDSTGATYWYFYGSRLYKEDPEPPKEQHQKKKYEVLSSCWELYNFHTVSYVSH